MTHRRRIARLLAPLALVAGGLSSASLPVGRAARDDESEARELLELGEEKAAKGHYDQAVSRYEKVVERYPGTEAAEIAAKRVKPNALLGWADLVRHGNPSNRVDIVVMGDGYERRSLKTQFHARAEEIPEAFEKEPTLEEYFPYFNFVRAAVVSADSGVDGYGREYDTALDAYVTSATETPFGAVKVERVRHYLDQLPTHDGIAVAIIHSETRALPTGPVATIGGGRVTVQEIVHAFGHAFAGLGDEYSDRTERHVFAPGARPNVSLSETVLPWQHWIDADHPSVGAYEGAAGAVNGAWRPVGGNCVMESGRDFCPVCREAVVLAIYGLVDPIDAVSHPPHPFASDESLEPELVPTSDTRYEDLELTVTPMQPASHELEATWWVLPEHRAPRSRGVELTSAERRARGPLPEIELEPVDVQRPSRRGTFELELDPSDWEPGRYRVVCRVHDSTEIRGEEYPWVLSDPQGLLWSERAWWVRVP